MSSGTGTGSHGGTGGGRFVPPSTAELDAILDAYEFIGLLGRGGMGAVYKARQKSLDRMVAIKILPPHLTTDEEEQGFHFAERFQREARAMGKLSHPNIIGVYDFGQAGDGQFYFVMEYIEGTDLNALIKTGQLTPDHVAGWMSQICEALQYAHSKGIVHRDIKPANIMITRESQVKIADFGLAKLTGASEVETKLTMTNIAMGTPDYVAPEVLEMGVEIDHRADLYAVGVMLYEMLTGKVPRGAWKPASVQVPGLDPRYDALIERAMDSDRDSRHQHASEISATIYEIATTATPATGAGEKSPPRLVMGDAVPAQREVRAPSTGTGPGKGDRRKSGPPPAKPKTRSPIGLIAGIVAGAVVLGLGLFAASKFDPEPVPTAREATPVETPSSELPKAAAPPAVPTATEDTTSPSSPEPGVAPFAGVVFPRDLMLPASRSWQSREGQIVLADTPPGEFPIFAVPEPLGEDYAFELDYAFDTEPRSPGYLKLLLPARDGWSSAQLHAGSLVFFSNGRRLTRPLPQTESPLTLRIEVSEGRSRFAIWVDGEKRIDEPDEGSAVVQNWQSVRPGVINIGGETKGGPPIAIHMIRVAPGSGGSAPGVIPPLTNVPGPASAPARIQRAGRDPDLMAHFARTRSALIDGIAEFQFQGQSAPGLIALRGADAMPLFVTPENQVFGVAVDPADTALPRMVFGSHSFFLQNIASMAPARRFFENSLAWLRGEDASPVLVLPDGFPWAARDWALEQGYRVETSPPEGGGGVLIVDTTHLFNDPVRLQQIEELLPRVDGVFVAITTWNFNRAIHPENPAESVFAPFGIGFPGGSFKLPDNFAVSPDLPDWAALWPGLADAVSAAKANPAPSPAPPLPPAPQAPADPRIARLESGFQAAYERDALQAFLTGVTALDAGLLGAIDRARAAAQGRGALDEVTSLDREKDRLTAGGGVPPADELGTPDALIPLRITYRETHARLTAARDAKAAPLYDIYLTSLDAYITELTQANQIDRAREVKALRDEIAARKSRLGAAPDTASGIAAPASADAEPPKRRGDPDRHAAEYLVAAQGASIVIDIGGGQISTVTPGAELPRGRFGIIELNLDRFNSPHGPVKKEDLLALVGLEKLRRVWIRPTDAAKLGDEAFAFLAGNEDLVWLNLEGARDVTDGILTHLADSKKLGFLAIQYAEKFTGKGLAAMPFKETLTDADFLGSGLSDEGIAELVGFPELQTLRITGATATGQGFALLAGLAKLHSLDLNNTAFDNKAAEAVATLPGLRSLNLERTAITDRGLAHLAALKQLTTLSLGGTDISDSAVARLQEALPDCRISR